MHHSTTSMASARASGLPDASTVWFGHDVRHEPTAGAVGAVAVVGVLIVGAGMLTMGAPLPLTLAWSSART